MQFFLQEIVARAVAIYLCVVCSRQLRSCLVERKTAYINNDVIDWLLVDWSKMIIHRDTAPIRYWITIGLRVFGLVGCIVVAIFGWFQPNP